MNTVGRAVIVFALMLLLTVHFSTGLLASFTEKVPRAVEGIDATIRIGLVSWLGHTNTQALLVFLTLFLPILVYYGSPRTARPLEPEPAAITPARMRRAVDRSPQSELSPENKQFMKNLLIGAIEQVAREHEMVTANQRPKPFVRLVPQVPILVGVPPRSWFGGTPSLPEGTAWPVCDGKPAEFLAQIDCSSLPADLWDGVGPRAGWLSFFLGSEEGYTVAKILHTQSRGAPVQPLLPVDSEWLYLSEIPTMDWTSLARRDVPKWPVDVVWVPSPEEDPLVREPVSGGRDGDPRAVRYQTGFALTEPGWKPFDWATTLLLLDTAIAYVRSNLRRDQQQLATNIEVLDQVLLDPAWLPGMTRERAEANLAWTKQRISAWETHLPDVEALRAKTATEAEAEPFSEARVDALISRLAAMKTPEKDGALTRQAFPTLSAPRVGGWLSDWAVLAQQHATYLYASDPRSLPVAWRAKVEEQAAFDAQYEMGAMRHVPDGYVHQFAMDSEVTLLQLPTSHLMNWMWGDTYDLVLTISRADLERGEFGQVMAQITN
ncbi:hypothetical protein ASE23_19425 [Rhizobium sp. Root73]|uniref:DUF1963 domain-containing protein n=2 Tax=unclassified Rhizobium TaxID=2613769 RepID=UPI0007136753|nr:MULTISPECIES: DUF1963 domain-containing protein [unclassified Rhizobium]KQV39557.1 hypothetical protein ASC96_21765 [Rhizobium sp. Root1204]KRB96009.1 hypothetical protein ASE23_19425 [Rhizobium sp. Root73]